MRIENPFSTELLINIPVNCFTYVNLIVRDVIGRKVYEHQLNIPDRFQIRIETSSWGNGVYLVELHSDHGTLYSKVLKQ
ncbi:MAG: T9SS type A sorting domain-containing protein [Bacteroidetes bacterium]|nr:T9SS type A sorting domain-containing protein [Bacteroidota bacterium]